MNRVHSPKARAGRTLNEFVRLVQEGVLWSPVGYGNYDVSDGECLGLTSDKSSHRRYSGTYRTS